jgi:nucleoside-diphosphate-sugar epimerase
MKKLSLLITGANGFVGRRACEYFMREEYDVLGFIRKPVSEAERVKGIKYVVGGVADYDALLKVTGGIDAIINLAAAKSDEKDSYETNVLGASNLIKASEINKVKSIIHMSTLSAKIPNRGLYGETKLEAEGVFLKSKVPTVILRPSIIYGDKAHGVFGSLVKATKLPVVPVIGNGETVFYPIFLDDLLCIIEMILKKGIKRTVIYDIGGKEKISLNDLIKCIAESERKRVYLLHIPVPIGLLIAHILSPFFYKAPITKSNILGSTQNVEVQMGKIYREINIKPRPLKAGLYEIFRG